MAPIHTIGMEGIEIEPRLHVSINRSFHDLFRPFRPTLSSLVPTVSLRLDIEDFCNYSSIQAGLRWRHAFLHLRPDFAIDIRNLERYYREKTQSLLAQLDDISFYRDKLKSACALGIQYHSILALKSLETVDLQAIEHVQCALESRLNFVLGVMSTQKSVTKGPSKDITISTDTLSRLIRKLDHSATVNPPINARGHEPYMFHSSRYLRCPILNNTAHDTQRFELKPECFCSWVLDWLPIPCLQWLAYDAETFTRGLHDYRHFLYSLGRELAARFKTSAESPEFHFARITDILHRAAIESFFIFFDYLELITRSVTHKSKELHRQPSYRALLCDAILHQVVRTAMDIADEFILWSSEKESPAITDASILGIMDDWIREREISEAIMEMLWNQVHDKNLRQYMAARSRKV